MKINSSTRRKFLKGGAALIGFPILFGMLFGLKAGFLLLGLRILSLVQSFSKGTADNSRFRLRPALWFSLFFFLTLTFLGLGGMSLFDSQQARSWLLCLGSMLAAGAIFWLYQWRYHSSRLDIMTQPRR